jgi:hypothetical protein
VGIPHIGKDDCVFWDCVASKFWNRQQEFPISVIYYLPIPHSNILWLSQKLTCGIQGTVIDGEWDHGTESR